jgi:hypothetical protein
VKGEKEALVRPGVTHPLEGDEQTQGSLKSDRGRKRHRSKKSNIDS